jgi:hypothetical protein
MCRPCCRSCSGNSRGNPAQATGAARTCSTVIGFILPITRRNPVTHHAFVRKSRKLKWFRRQTSAISSLQTIASLARRQQWCVASHRVMLTDHVSPPPSRFCQSFCDHDIRAPSSSGRKFRPSIGGHHTSSSSELFCPQNLKGRRSSRVRETFSAAKPSKAFVLHGVEARRGIAISTRLRDLSP